MTSSIVSRESVYRQERDGAQDWDPCHTDVPEWLHEFRENLGDARVSERTDLHASFSHVSLEATRSADRGKHRVCGHFL